MHDSYPFRLRSLSLTQSIDSTIDFVRDQTQVVQLVLFSSTRPRETQEPDPDIEPDLPPIILPLKSLWATPWWSKLILPHCSANSFGLLHDGSRADERYILRSLIDALVEEGGHPTIECLTLCYEDFMWDHETVGLDRYGAAFPNARKICIALPGVGPIRIASALSLINIEIYLVYIKQLAEKYPNCPFPSLKELVFLRPGDYWPNPYDEPYQIDQMGRCFVVELLVVLGGIFPGLKHVDFLRTCFTRTPGSDEWTGRLRRCRH
ncbi:hypothetical protein RhiJN_12142 [Ceratobasidium sp. AG-Ba]|nr:hypothetical protein RhiJN_12142 [Ceratobasidium sp. AG-Ba]